MSKAGPTFDRLHEVLDYNPDTGIFTWRVQRGRAFIAHTAGSIRTDGYRGIKIDGVSYGAHRLAFLYMIGDWPEDEIDHINNIRDDNRWDNLRPATSQQNNYNMSIRNDNVSSYKGVSFHKASGKIRAVISIKKRPKHLGLFDTKKEAYEAYTKAARLHYGKFARPAKKQGASNDN